MTSAALATAWAPWSWVWNVSRFSAAYRAKDWSRAERYLDAAELRGADAKDMAGMRATLYWKAGDRQKSATALGQLRKLDPVRAEEFDRWVNQR